MYIKLFTGAMGSGKSNALISHYDTFGNKYHSIAFKPKMDTRTPNMISSRNGRTMKAIEVSDFNDIIENIEKIEKLNHIYIDEIQFLDHAGLKSLVEYCIRKDITIICSGLDLTSELDIFKTTAYMMSYATHVEKVKAMCDCGSRRPTIFTDCKVSKESSIVVGGDDIYKGACEKCHSMFKEEV